MAASVAAYGSGSGEPCAENTVQAFVESVAELIELELDQPSGKRSRVRQ